MGYTLPFAAFPLLICSLSAAGPVAGPSEVVWSDQGDAYYVEGRRIPLLRSAASAPDPQRSSAPPNAAVFLEPSTGLRVTILDRVVVRLKPGSDPAPLLASTGLRLLESLRLPDTYLLACDDEPLRTADRLRAEPEVVWAEPEFIGEVEPTAYIPNDPRFKDQWFLRNTGQFGGKVGADLNTVPAWDITMGRREITVTIFDEGAPMNHPDLRLSPMSRNFIPNPPSNDPSPESPESIHGVSCAGLAGAIGDNALGVAGVAPNITILAAKVLDWPIRKFASNVSVANSVLYAAEASDVGSISVGVFGSNTVRDAIRQAVRTGRKGKGWLLFKSSGNDNADRIHGPGDMEEVSSVGASNDKDMRASYSNWGREGTKTVDFLAPGQGSGGMWTTDLLGSLGSSSGDFTSSFGGTSAATPCAAGVAALVLSVNPEFTRQQVLDIMRRTCRKIGGVNYVGGVHPQYGWGHLDAGAAVAEAKRQTSVGLARGPADRPRSLLGADADVAPEFLFRELLRGRRFLRSQ